MNMKQLGLLAGILLVLSGSAIAADNETIAPLPPGDVKQDKVGDTTLLKDSSEVQKMKPKKAHGKKGHHAKKAIQKKESEMKVLEDKEGPAGIRH